MKNHSSSAPIHAQENVFRLFFVLVAGIVLGTVIMLLPVEAHSNILYFIGFISFVAAVQFAHDKHMGKKGDEKKTVVSNPVFRKMHPADVRYAQRRRLVA